MPAVMFVVLGPYDLSATPVFSGVYYHTNGDVYNGEFIDSKMDGMGTYRKADGSFITGAARARLLSSPAT